MKDSALSVGLIKAKYEYVWSLLDSTLASAIPRRNINRSVLVEIQFMYVKQERGAIKHSSLQCTYIGHELITYCCCPVTGLMWPRGWVDV
jgi:hypothetical protein